MTVTITTSVDQFRAALAPLSGSTKTPMLGSSVNISFIAPDEVAFAATNFTTTAFTSFTLDKWTIENEHHVSVDYDKLISLIATSEGDITVSVNDKHLSISCGRLNAKLPIMPPVSLNDRPEAEPWCQVLASELRACIDFVIHSAAARNEARENLKAICFRMVDGSLSLETTDGLRFSQVPLPYTQLPLVSAQDRVVLIPAHGVRDFIRSVDANDMIEIRLTEGTAEFHTSDVTWVTAVYGLSYPDIMSIIGQWRKVDDIFTAVIDRKDLLNAVKACSHFQFRNDSDRWSKTTITCDQKAITVTADTPEGSASIIVPGTYERSFSTSAQARYLLDALGSLSGDEVTLEVTSPQKGLILSTEGVSGLQGMAVLV